MVSPKKKNTYILKIQNTIFSSFPNLFSMCESTPLPVIEINGQPQSKDEWLSCPRFPNPGATDMCNLYPQFKDAMGERMASTVVEYLDKETCEPVALLFPHTVHYKRPDFRDRLNHASRRDFDRQIAMRIALVEKYRKANGK